MAVIIFLAKLYYHKLGFDYPLIAKERVNFLLGMISGIYFLCMYNMILTLLLVFIVLENLLQDLLRIHEATHPLYKHIGFAIILLLKFRKSMKDIILEANIPEDTQDTLYTNISLDLADGTTQKEAIAHFRGM